jgi:hypothetical protein
VLSRHFSVQVQDGRRGVHRKLFGSRRNSIRKCTQGGDFGQWKDFYFRFNRSDTVGYHTGFLFKFNVAPRIPLYPFACRSGSEILNGMITILLPLLFANLRLASGVGWTSCLSICVDYSCPGTFTFPYNFSCLCSHTVNKIGILQCFLDSPNCTSADFAAGILGALSVCGNFSPSVYA